VHDYYHKSYEAHERIAGRRREAEAERIIHRARIRRHRRRRAQLAGALGLLSGARRGAGQLRLTT
jgi:hypothetical protein